MFLLILIKIKHKWSSHMDNQKCHLNNSNFKQFPVLNVRKFTYSQYIFGLDGWACGILIFNDYYFKGNTKLDMLSLI